MWKMFLVICKTVKNKKKNTMSTKIIFWKNKLACNCIFLSLRNAVGGFSFLFWVFMSDALLMNFLLSMFKPNDDLDHMLFPKNRKIKLAKGKKKSKISFSYWFHLLFFKFLQRREWINSKRLLISSIEIENMWRNFFYISSFVSGFKMVKE